MNNVNKIYAKPNQTIWDVALEQFGAIEGVWDVITENESVENINTNIATAQELNILKDKVYNADVLQYYKSKSIFPASLIVADLDDSLLTEDGDCLLTESGDCIIEETPALLTEDGLDMQTEDGETIIY